MISINLVKTTNYDDARLTILKSALALIPPVLNSQNFKDAVINYKTNGQLTFSFKKNLFKDFEHYTNQQVYDMIMQAQEDPGNVADGSIDLYLELLPGGGGSTIGYGNPGEETIYTYQDWFDQAKPEEIVNHITHEWCHKIGFDHAAYPWQDKFRENSVPYGVGDLVEGFCGLPNLTPLS
jgi:hypothetical protein